MSNYHSPPLPDWWYGNQDIKNKKGKAKSVFLDITNLNPHNFYFMANILDKVTEEQLEISKNLGEIKEKLSKWSGMTKDSTERAILEDMKHRVRELEEDYDSWMLELKDDN